MRIAVLQGPNMNRLGLRKPEIYGGHTLADIQGEMDKRAVELGVELLHFQSNSEGELIDFVQQEQDDVDALICNPAGLTPYGRSLWDALAEMESDLAIVHLSNVHAREHWRRHDIFAEIATIYLAGLGSRGYLVALNSIYERHEDESSNHK